MSLLTFLYAKKEAASEQLRDALGADLKSMGGLLWSDARTEGAAFNEEVDFQLRSSAAIVHCIGPAGAGFYQGSVEVRKTIEALDARSDRRLVIVLLGGAQIPAEFTDLGRFVDRMKIIAAPADLVIAAKDVVDAALPNGVDRARMAELAKLADKQANDIIDRTIRKVPSRSLTIVVGPYACAESMDLVATPTRGILKMLRGAALPGFAPWFEVMGSIAFACANDKVEAARRVVEALQAVRGVGTLRTYLRMVAASWELLQPAERLFIVSCSPENDIDDMLSGKDGTPVQHVRLVHCTEAQGLIAERKVGSDAPQRIANPRDSLKATDRVVLLKPFGSFDHAERAIFTAEEWREYSNIEMPLPRDMAMQMAKSYVIVLGAGGFSPSLQMVFNALLKTALHNPDGESNRFLLHNPDARVADVYHRTEAMLARGKREDDNPTDRFLNWLLKTYNLRYKMVPPLSMLAALDDRLNSLRRDPGAGRAA